MRRLRSSSTFNTVNTSALQDAGATGFANDGIDVGSSSFTIGARAGDLSQPAG